MPLQLQPDTYALRYMRRTDIAQVALVDQQSFSTPWSASSYAREVSQSHYSHMLVVERTQQIPPRNRLHEVWQQFTGASQFEHKLLAYGGLWAFPYEGHISTLASHPGVRRQGWGELALLALLRKAQEMDIWRVSLEVRVSNTRARRLYEKYGFQERGIKPEYYYDNNEDAYDMRLDLDVPSNRAYIQARYQDYLTRHSLRDNFTQTAHP